MVRHLSATHPGQRRDEGSAVRYARTAEDEVFELPRVSRLGCCDCGLIHDVAWSVFGKRLFMRVRRNERATAQRRRHLKVKK
jgi:hypothetical protein